MKNHLRIGLVILIAAGLVSCVEQGGLKAGTATGKSMLKLIPASARMVFMVDIHRSLTADAVTKALKDEKMKQKYDGFVKMAGLDPMKDIYFLAVGLSGTPAGNEREGAIIVNLRYDKGQLLAKLKLVAKNLQEETYNGLTVYKNVDAAKPGKMAPAGAFLDDSNIVLGTDKTVRAVIDVYQKKADSVDKSPEMKKLFKLVNMSANVWAAVAIPPGMLKQAADKNPMLKDLVGVTGLTLSFDYANKTLTTEVQSLGGTKEQNKTLAERLIALKSMGALVTAKLPLQGELLNTIEISSGDDHVKIYSSIPAELMEKLQAMAQEKLGSLMQASPQAPKEEKKEGKKEGAEVKK
jgi:hypothetical protein